MGKKNSKRHVRFRRNRGHRSGQADSEGIGVFYQAFAQDTSKNRSEILVNLSDLAEASDPGKRREWKQLQYNLHIRSLTYPSVCNLYLVIAESGVTFTESDVVNTATVQTILDTSMDKNFSYTKIGALVADQLSWQPQNAAVGVASYHSKSKVFDFTRHINKIAKKLESGEGIGFEAMIVGICQATNTTSVVVEGQTKSLYSDVIRTFPKLTV